MFLDNKPASYPGFVDWHFGEFFSPHALVEVVILSKLSGEEMAMVGNGFSRFLIELAVEQPVIPQVAVLEDF